MPPKTSSSSSSVHEWRVFDVQRSLSVCISCRVDAAWIWLICSVHVVLLFHTHFPLSSSLGVLFRSHTCQNKSQNFLLKWPTSAHMPNTEYRVAAVHLSICTVLSTVWSEPSCFILHQHFILIILLYCISYGLYWRFMWHCQAHQQSQNSYAKWTLLFWFCSNPCNLSCRNAFCDIVTQ